MACSIKTTFCKGVLEVLDYRADWATWLGSDTISTSDWTVPTGLVEDSDSNTTTDATVILSGGVVGTTYTVSNTIVTAAGLTAVRSFYLNGVER